MKKFILLYLVCLPLFFLAQTNKQKPTQPVKGNERDRREIADKNKVKPIVLTGSKQYDLVKAEGRLAHYEVVQKEGKIVSIEQTTYGKTGSVTTSTLTSCDVVPPGTTPSFGAPLDDQTTALLNLPFTFCFYGNNYTQVRMSSNGNIQFPPTNNASFSSNGFPAPNDIMIAPFWADLDNRGTGTFSYDIFGTYAVFTWGSVGYYASHTNLTVDFQMVITDGLDPVLPPGKNVGFYYGTMQWTTGDASSGIGGFPNPTITPAIPATVGANAGNGIDYFLIGRFGQPGSAYDGPLGADDGVSWLDGKKFYFNACPPVGANAEPLMLSGPNACIPSQVCGNDTLYQKLTFSGPEASQTVTVTASAPTLGASFTYSTLPNANSTDIYIIIDGSTAPGGFHVVTVTATDNGVPVQTSVQSYSVFVNQGALNNLNGSIVLTPTIGACPGQTVSASVTVSGGIPDSYLWSNNSTNTSTTFTTVVPADSLIFVTLQSGLCQKTIIGDININPVPVANISGNLSFCNGDASSTVLTATNTLNPASQGPHTYNWAGTGTLSSTSTESPTVNGGVYTVTVTNQFGCISVATTTVVMYDSPNYTLTSSNAISGGSVYCVNQDTARIAINYGPSSSPICGVGVGLCATPNIVSLGTATGANSNTSFPSVYGNYYKNVRHQMLYTAAELLASGAIPGKMSSISFQMNSALPTGTTSAFYIGTLPNYSIKMKCTSNTALTSTFDGAGLTQVFIGNVTPTVGVNTHTFSQPYIWDGISNLIVDVCYTRTTSLASTYYTSNPIMPYTNTGVGAANVKCVYFNSDGTLACGNTTGTISNNRPDIKFGNCFAPQSGTQFNVVVTPSVGVVIPSGNDSIRFDLPSTPGITCYTVSVINPIGNCSKDTVICIAAMQGITQGTLVASNYSVCPGDPVTLTAQGSLTSYTIEYIDASGAQTTTVSPVTFNAPNTVGPYTYTLWATGPCGGPLTSFTNTVTVIQGVTIGNLTFSQDSVCPGTPVTISANGPILPTYTITYGPAVGDTVVGHSVTVTPTLTTNGFQTYTLTAQGACGGPVTNFIDSVQVQLGTTNATITATADTLCPGSPITLNYIGTLATFTMTYTDATGIHTSTTVPITYTPMSITNPTFGYVYYSLTGEGPCNGPTTTFVDSVFIKQGLTQATVTATADTLCPGSPITLNYTGVLTTFTVTYTDATGIHTSTTVPVTYTPMAVANPTFGYVTYTVTGAGPCSGPVTSFRDSVFIKQGVTQGTLAVNNNTLCPGSNVTLSALGTLASYTIAYVDANGNLQTSPNSSVTFMASSIGTPVFGIHTYSLIAQGPCSGPITVFTNTVDVIQGITNATLVATPGTVCIGSPVTLSATGSLSTYTISYNNGVVTNSINSPVTFNTAIAGVNTYTLKAQGFCSAPINPYTASVLVNNLTTLTITPMVNVTKCLNGSVILEAIVAASTAAPYSYSWFPAVGTNTNSTYVTSTPVTTTFVVVVNGTCASPATASVVVSNFPTNINVVIIDSASVCASTELVLHSAVSGGKSPYTYNWTISPDVNSISTIADLNVIAPANEGNYTMMVVATDACGFTDTDIQLVNVLPPCGIEIGNIITPNGDGANDFFKIKNIEYHPNTSLNIFDRWGKKVYSNTAYFNEWKGEGLNDGTYFYILEVPDDKKYNGFVQILR